jgi:hypothetical protein
MVSKERNHLGSLDADRLIILKCVLDMWAVKMSTVLHWLRIESSDGVFGMMGI